jgi:acetoin utilization deacetylase AcuC-like enzyme
MKIFHTTHHYLHHPPYELFNGERIDNPEIPERVGNILQALKNENYPMEVVSEVTNKQEILLSLSQIHDPQYLDWIRNTQVHEALYASVFNNSTQFLFHGHQSIQWGNFVTDTFTPLLPHTWQAALETAQAVYSATRSIIAGDPTSIVISRPPGHHAGRSKVGGYCYLNNAGLAAELLSKSGRVAILDVDYHHGNGTQEIFYHRRDVVTCSIHADPHRKFPYFSGFSEENGAGEGMGYNRNYPLPADIKNEEYQKTLDTALAWIDSIQPNYLIISLGLDTHESDPICDFQLTTNYYKTMAETISQLKLPTIVILEGGYSTQAIGANMVSFMAGLKE